jgi:uncharacterized lipoprotein YmbA
LKSVRHSACAGVMVSLLSCASSPDHFYTLSTLPQAAQVPAAAPTTHVILNVAVPALVDRREMVINTSSDRVSILEHQRWASPLPDQVSQTLARDIEARRGDVLVGDRSFDQASAANVKIKVEVVRMSAQKDGRATLEAHWHLIDAAGKTDEVGSGVFSAPLEAGAEYAAVARGFSACLSSLAERLVDKLPVH